MKIYLRLRILSLLLGGELGILRTHISLVPHRSLLLNWLRLVGESLLGGGCSLRIRRHLLLFLLEPCRRICIRIGSVVLLPVLVALGSHVDHFDSLTDVEVGLDHHAVSLARRLLFAVDGFTGRRRALTVLAALRTVALLGFLVLSLVVVAAA